VFLGHFAVAFAAKKAAPTVSLGTFFVAAQLADLVWPVFFLAGLEDFEISPGVTAVTPLAFTHYPYSHSLVALTGWAIAVASIFLLVRRGTLAAAAVLAALVLSHWVLDVVAHRPDMPVTMTGPLRVGMGLWNSVAATVLVETALFAWGVLLYYKTRRSRGGAGHTSLWTLVAFLLVIYVSTIVGPPPGSKIVVPIAGLAMWLLVAWAYWVDRQRPPVSPISA
jgi:hypothetical protein